jgi:tetratricopeptide (TPR) repeat protein
MIAVWRIIAMDLPASTRKRVPALCAAFATAVLLVVMAAQARAEPVRHTPSLAALYPGLTGRASEKLKKRWNVISDRTLLLLLQCMESQSANLPDRAIMKCSEAIALQPTNSGAYKLRGQAHFMKGEYRLALSDFDTSIRLDDSDQEAYAGRGDTLRNMGSYTRAISDYSTALVHAPNEARLWNARCWTRAIAGTGLPLALKDCGRAIDLNPSLAQAFTSRGLVYLRLNKLQKSLDDYNQAVRLWPGFSAALYGRGLVEARLGQLTRSRRDFASALARDPDVAGMYASFGVRPNVTGLPSSKKCLRCLQTLPTPKPKPLTLPSAVDTAWLKAAAR